MVHGTPSHYLCNNLPMLKKIGTRLSGIDVGNEVNT